MPTWTAEQQQAIDLRNKSILVAAAAGSGKTAVLVERIIQMISDEANPVMLDQLLIVTFTSAAASEMKERIGLALQKQLLENPMSGHLYRQSLLLQKAQITTLHSFCLELVRQNYFRLGLDPGMKIADATENQLLLEECMDIVLERHYDEDNRDFAAFVDQYGGKQDEQLRAVLHQLFRIAESMPVPEIWLRKIATASDIDWFDEAMADIGQKCYQIRQSLMKAIRLAEEDEGLVKYLPVLENEYNWSCELTDAVKQGWDSAEQKLRQAFFDRMPAVKNNACDVLIKEQVTAFRKKAKDTTAALLDDYFSRTRDEQEAELAAQQPVRRMFSTLALELVETFQAAKAEKGLMDFSDMEHFCFHLLYDVKDDGTMQTSELAGELQSQYAEVMVDEYQDTNDLQEAILQAVSRSNNLFMVGDMKQSIYGFRMANPKLFASKYELFGIESEKHKRLDLNRNFRCRDTVVKAVNELFVQLMCGTDGDLLYDKQAELVYGADYPQCPEETGTIPSKVSLMVLTDAVEEEKIDAADTDTESLGTMESEAILLSRTMQRLMQEGTPVYDKHLQQYRRVQWRDMVVLVRAPKSTGPAYLRVMKEAGIPAVVDVGDGYFTAWEIQIILSLLHIVDNPLQDIPLLAVLRAPFFAFTEDNLAQLRLLAPDRYFYDCLECAANTAEDETGQEVSPELQQKTKEFLERLSRWRNLARHVELSAFIWQIYKETGFYEYVGALRDGMQRQANLRALQDRAAAYEKTSFKGVFAFLRFLEQMQKNNADLEPARVLGDNENVVRILSIHKSKGLEFPIVFVGGLGKKFNVKDVQQDFLSDRQYGIAFSFVDADNQVKYRTIAQKVISHNKRQELLQEEKRILYVAMTRAREQLYLVGSCKDPLKCRLDSMEYGKSYLDWLMTMKRSEELWDVQYYSTGNLQHAEPETTAPSELLQAVRNHKAVPVENELYAQIDAQLSWCYPDDSFVTVKGQSSVTELKTLHRKQREAQKGETPEFRFDTRPDAIVKKAGLTAAEKGTLLHLMMQHVNLDVQVTYAYLKQLAARLEAEKYIAAGSTEGLYLKGILDFFNGPLGQRLKQASPDARYRELPFIVAMDSHAIYEELPQQQKNILVQGIIDCLWKENDGWVLVDYKSDHIYENEQQILLERYRDQIAIYCYAVEQILREPVKEAWFYLLSAGKAIPVPLDSGKDTYKS